MKPILALAQKDLRLLFRDRASLFWILAFPIAFAGFFGVIFGNNGDGGGGGAISLACVDEDESEASRALLAKLDANEAVRLTRSAQEAGAVDGAAPSPPALLLSGLDEAREAVQKGRKMAYLRVPSGFGDNPYAVFGGSGGPELEIGIDPGRQAEAGFLQGIVMEAVMSSLQERFLDRETLLGDLAAARAEVRGNAEIAGAQKLVLQGFLGALNVFVEQFDFDLLGGEEAAGEGGAGSALSVVDVTRQRGRGPRSAFEITFPQALVWGLMSAAMAFAIMLVRERSAGTLVRLQMAPIRRSHLLAGRALACFLGCMITMGLLLAVSAVLLGVRFDSLPLLLLAMVCTAACFTGLTMTISVLGKTESAVAGSAWGVMMPFMMIGGGMIPILAMPEWLVTASHFSPFKWAIVAVEGATWRGFELVDMALPCGILLATGALFFGIGVNVLRRSDG